MFLSMEMFRKDKINPYCQEADQQLLGTGGRRNGKQALRIFWCDENADALLLMLYTAAKLTKTLTSWVLIIASTLNFNRVGFLKIEPGTLRKRLQLVLHKELDSRTENPRGGLRGV